jgi:tRNA threonylcarbamoyladenosine biosynthesis protein TsaE
MEWSFSLDNINNVAKEFWKAADDKTVFAFHGPMGSGKTTFIHALCDVKGVKDVVGSPTFSIINEYEYSCEGTKRILFHIDLYRLKDEEEAPEKAPGIFPENTVHVFIELLDSEIRRVNIKNS